MNDRITRREVAKQFIVAIDLLLEWIEQKENSDGESMGKVGEEASIETRLLTAPEVARILNISKGVAYILIKLENIPSVRINSSVRVKQEERDKSIDQRSL